MKYIDDQAKLAKVIDILAQYQTDIQNYFFAAFNTRLYQISTVEERMVTLFILANADRQGKGKDNVNLVKATASFRKYVSGDLIDQINQLEPPKAHKLFFTSLCDIYGMEQKTANLFIKYLVMFQHDFNLNLYDWELMEPYLDVPLDIWVLRLIGKRYLNVCTDQYEEDFYKKTAYISPGFKSVEYITLQNEIKEITSCVGKSAITADALWFVGNKYCSYRPLLCKICWLKEFCNSSTDVDWNKVTSILKSKEREKERQANEFMKEICNKWVSENPGKTQWDFMKYIQTPRGRQWLNQFF